MHTDLDEQYDKIYRYCYMKLRHQQTSADSRRYYAGNLSPFSGK